MQNQKLFFEEYRNKIKLRLVQKRKQLLVALEMQKYVVITSGLETKKWVVSEKSPLIIIF